MKKEVIDGVLVVHTGIYIQNQEDGIDFELIKMYDENGNVFYSNHDSLEQALLEVAFFENHGINAVVGPKAPWHYDDVVMQNPHDEVVGVYLVDDNDLEERINAIPKNDYFDFLEEYLSVPKKLREQEEQKKRRLSMSKFSK